MRWANDLTSLLWVTTAFALPFAAQGVNYPAAGVPRGPDGKPNLSAPALPTAIPTFPAVPARRLRGSPWATKIPSRPTDW